MTKSKWTVLGLLAAASAAYAQPAPRPNPAGAVGSAGSPGAAVLRAMPTPFLREAAARIIAGSSVASGPSRRTCDHLAVVWVRVDSSDIIQDYELAEQSDECWTDITYDPVTLELQLVQCQNPCGYGCHVCENTWLVPGDTVYGCRCANINCPSPPEPPRSVQ